MRPVIVRRLQDLWSIRETKFTVLIVIGLLLALDQEMPRYLRFWVGSVTLIAIPLIWTRFVAAQLAYWGKYEWALRINELLPPLFGTSVLMEAWILLVAGRYHDAQEAVSKLAFDSKGEPRTNEFSLYLYAKALLAKEGVRRRRSYFEPLSKSPLWASFILGWRTVSWHNARSRTLR